MNFSLFLSIEVLSYSFLQVAEYSLQKQELDY